jgi:hypothetical protein
MFFCIVGGRSGFENESLAVAQRHVNDNEDVSHARNKLTLRIGASTLGL